MDAYEYLTGKNYFPAAQMTASSSGDSNYLLNILASIKGAGGIRDREKGFIDALASRAAVGCRPSPITIAAELEAGVREIEADVWGLLRSGTPEQIAGLIRDMVLDGGFTSLVFLDVVAATAMNGALN